MSNDEYRAEQAERRQHGLKARQEQRLENATYTAAEVKVLTEAALRLGRKEAGEEIAEALEALNPKASTLACAFLAREIASQPSPDATSGRTDPVHKPFPDDGVTYCGWHVGDGVVHEGCGEVWPCSTVRNHRNPNREDV